jgi:hypothetical protein
MLFGANLELRQHVLRNRNNPSLRGNPPQRIRCGGPAGREAPKQGDYAAGPGIPNWVTERRPKVPTLPPAANPLLPRTASPWLAPIRFGVKPYLEFCRSLDQALAELEARYPSHRRVLTLEARDRIVKRKRKRKPK